MNRFRQVNVLAAVVLLVGTWATVAAGQKVVKLKIARYTDASLTDSEADAVLCGMTNVLRTSDGTGDAVCDIVFVRDGSVAEFTVGDGSVDSAAEYNDLLARVPAHVLVVDEINWCGWPSSSAVGCAPCPGTQIIVERTVVTLEGILWAHERGHSCGLDHRNAANAVMRSYLGTTHRQLNADESTRYLSCMAMDCVVGGADAALAAEEKVPIKEFVQRIYVHGIPWDEASRYTAAEAAQVLPLLDDPKQAELHANIIETAAVIGDKSAVAPILAYFSKEGAISRPEYRAKLAAVMHLGTLHNKVRDAKVLEFLQAGATNPEFWPARAKWTVEKRAPEKVSGELSNMAVWGLALSGSPEAAETLESLKGNEKTPQGVKATVAEAAEVAKQVQKDGLLKYWQSKHANHGAHNPN